MTNKVLIPLDGSKTAEQALELLKQWLVSGQVSEVILTRVEPPTPEVVVDYPLPIESVLAANDEKIRRAQDYLDEISGCIDWRGVAHRSVVRLGDPIATLARLAREQHADLVLTAVEKRRGLRALGHASADRILRAFSIPVLVLGQSGPAAELAPRTCEIRREGATATPARELSQVTA
jgi:nucleotide-binding universal stress UspA family protein